MLLLLVGVAVGRFALLPEDAARVLDAVVIRIALPALVVHELVGISLDPRMLVPVAVAWSTLALLAVAVWLLARLLRFDALTTGTLLVVVPLGNTSFLGFPAVEALLGRDHLAPAVVYDQLGTFLALATYATFVAGRYGASPSSRGAGPVARLLRFPPFLALLAALVLRPVGLPPVLDELTGVLGATVTPLAMLSIGLRLDLRAVTHRPLALGTGLSLRMLVAPAAVLLVARLVGADGPVWDVAQLEAAMPPMVTAAVVAAEAGLDARLAAALTGAGVVLAMVTLPLWTLAL